MKITKREQEVLDYINDLNKRNESTAMREIARHFSVSLMTIQRHVISMEKKGIIVVDKSGFKAKIRAVI